jgi:hypothetical protein
MPTNSDVIHNTNWNHAVYMLGKMMDAIHILVTNEGDARTRLRKASPYIVQLIPEMLPIESGIRERVENARKILTKYYDPEEYKQKYCPYNTIFDSTLSRISNKTGSKAISELFGAWMELRELVHQHYQN